MGSISSITLSRFIVQSGNNDFAMKKLISDAATGQNSDISVVDNIFGAKVRVSSKVSQAALGQIGSGINVLSSAISTLEKIEQILESVQLMLIGLDLADNSTLNNIQNDYILKVRTIIQALSNIEFGGTNLFNGRLADPTNTLTNEALPFDAAPWKVLASNDVNDIISISIPRLLAGDGSVSDVDAPGRFTPLFPWNPEALSSVVAITNAVDTAIAGDPSPAANNMTDAHTPSGVKTNAKVNSLDVGEARGMSQVGARNQDAVDYIKAQIEVIRPAGANVFINAIFDTAKAILSLGSIANIANMKDAIITLARASATQASDESEAAINDITVKLNTSGGLNSLENSCDVITAPANASPEIKAIYDVVRAAGASKFITTYPSLAQMRIGAVNAAKAATSANPELAAGDVLTPASRKFVKELLAKAMDKTTSLIANLSGFRRSLQNATTSTSANYVEYSDSARNYLDPNYPKLISEMLQLKREGKVSSIAYSISETDANLAIDFLARANQN